jgi:hypothetical protein
VLRNLCASLVIEEMFRGTALIYVDFVDYDELAHHYGPKRAEALDALHGVDRVVGFIEKAAADAPRPYRFVVLSDHGQSLGATFRQRYDKTLDELVQELVGPDASLHVATKRAEHRGPLAALLSEARLGALAAAFHPRSAAAGSKPEETPELVVAASGNLGLVSLPRIPGRVARETIERTYPRLIDGLVRHPGVGLVMVRTASDGAVVLGSSGARYLRDGRTEGQDPLSRYGATAMGGLARLDEMPNCPDLVVISLLDGAGEVASFEEQIGVHGGLGGSQTEAFVLHPADWTRREERPVGALALHEQLRAWLADLVEASTSRAPS